MMPTSGMGQSGGLGSMAMGAMFNTPGGYMAQGMGEQVASSLIGGAQSLTGGVAAAASTITGVAGIASLLGGAALPVVGGAVGVLGGLPAMTVAGGLGMGAWGVGQAATGMDQRQQLARVMRSRFGGMMGAGGGNGGVGFSATDIGGMSTMVREMAGSDMFTSFEELTRVLDRTGQGGLYRGVQNARQFRERFRQTVDTLREIAQTMHTSLEGATQFLEGQRAQGFFTGREITSSMMQTRLQAGASGISAAQMQQIGLQGTQMGRMMGMRGRSGSAAMRAMATSLGVQMQTGMLSDEMVAEATGGATGAEGAQILAAQQMQVAQRFFGGRRAGRVVLAGLWDPETGGINEDRLREAMSGNMTFHQARSRGRENVRRTGGRNSEFFLDQNRILGELMETGQGVNLEIAMLEQHYGHRGWTLDDPAMQRVMQRHLGVGREEVDVLIQQYRNAPQAATEQRLRMNQQLNQEARVRSREVSGVEGFRRRFSNMLERTITNPLRQAGDDLTTSIARTVEETVREIEGRVEFQATEEGRRAYSALARGEGTEGQKASLRSGQRLLAGATVRSMYQSRDPSLLRRFGSWSGFGAQSTSEMLTASGFGAPGMTAQAAQEQLSQITSGITRGYATTHTDLGMSEKQFGAMQGQMADFITSRQLTNVPSTWDRLRGRSNDLAVARERVRQLDEANVGGISRVWAKRGEAEKIGMLERFTGERFAGTGYETNVGGAGLSREATLRGLERLHEEQAEGMRILGNSFNTRNGRPLSYEMMRGNIHGPGQLPDEGASNTFEFQSLFRATGESSELTRHLRAALGGTGEDIRQNDALTSLRLLASNGRGTGVFQGVDLDRSARGALKGLVHGSPRQKDVALGLLDRQTSIAMATELVQRGEMYTGVWERINRSSESFKQDVQHSSRHLLDSYLRKRSAGDPGGAAEAALFAHLTDPANAKNAQDLQTLTVVLGRDTSTGAKALTGGLQATQGYIGRYSRSSGTGRTTEMLRGQLSGMLGEGQNVNQIFRGREMQTWARKLELGKTDTTALVEFMQKRGAEFTLTAGEVQRNLGEFAGFAKEGIDDKELRTLGTRVGRGVLDRAEAGGRSKDTLLTVNQQQLNTLKDLLRATIVVGEKTSGVKDMLAQMRDVTLPAPPGGTNAQGTGTD